MLDVDRIAPRLWQGSFPTPGPEVHTAGIDVLVLCAEELQLPSTAYPGVEVIHAPMDDGPRVPVQRATRTARLAAAYLRRGKNVLVTCAKGRNRSGLVVALILWHMLPRATGKQCADRVQQRRSGSLTNPYFYHWLAMLKARR